MPKFEIEHYISREQLDKVKAHVSKHKTKYWAGSLVVVAGTTYLVTRRIGAPQITVAPVFNNMPVFTNVVNNGGHMRKIVRCIETGELWLSVTEAAAAQGRDVTLMSRHLNHPDLVPSINKLHFVVEALAAG